MAGILIHEVSGYSGSAYNLKIPSLSDPANIQEAMMLFHYGIDNYDGTGEPAAQSVFGNLKDFDDRIAALEESEVVSLAGTLNEVTVSGSVGFVTVGLPDSVVVSTNLNVGSSIIAGSGSVSGALSMGSGSVTGGLVVLGSSSLAGINATSASVNGIFTANGSATFNEHILAKKGINVFATTVDRDAAITSPATGTIVYIINTNQQLVYNGVAWVVIESGSGMEDIFLLMGA